MSNVRAGDLAYITGDCSSENRGRFVEILEHAPLGEFDCEGIRYKPDSSNLYWLCKAIGPDLAVHSAITKQVKYMVRIRPIPDSQLRPIRDNPGEDESFRWAPSPTQKELA